MQSAIHGSQAEPQLHVYTGSNVALNDNTRTEKSRNVSTVMYASDIENQMLNPIINPVGSSKKTCNESQITHISNHVSNRKRHCGNGRNRLSFSNTLCAKKPKTDHIRSTESCSITDTCSTSKVTNSESPIIIQDNETGSQHSIHENDKMDSPIISQDADNKGTKDKDSFFVLSQPETQPSRT